MKISKFLHSCIVLEKDGTRLLFDPGTFTFIEGRVKPEDFQNISAVFITHNHTDHCDTAALKIILENNPGISVFANHATHDALIKEGIQSELFDTGEKSVGFFVVRALSAPHEIVLGACPENTAYFVDDVFLHPGDSLNKSLYETKPKVLALPTFAPWGSDAVFEQFLVHVAPENVVPIHDGYIKEFFFARKYAFWKSYCEERGIGFRALELGETWEI